MTHLQEGMDGGFALRRAEYRVSVMEGHIAAKTAKTGQSIETKTQSNTSSTAWMARRGSRSNLLAGSWIFSVEVGWRQ